MSEGGSKKNNVSAKTSYQFQLEVTPKKFIIPSTGLLDVTIKSISEKELSLRCQFDSFCYEMKPKDHRLRPSYPSFARHLAYFRMRLKPGATLELTIGFPEKKSTKGNAKYHYKTPEGFFDIVHCDHTEFTMERDPTPDHLRFAQKTFELFSGEETEKMATVREEFLKMRKDEERTKRWDSISPNSELHHFDLRNVMPSKLEELDKMTDEEIKERKLNKMKQIQAEPENHESRSGLVNEKEIPISQLELAGMSEVNIPDEKKQNKKNKKNPCCGVM